MLKLYDYVLSGSCYKVRLLLNFLGLAYDTESVDFYPGKQHRNAAFLGLNPLGQLPVLDDDGLVLRDAQAILCHLANAYDPTARWLPRDPQSFGPTMVWLNFAGGELMAISAARMIAMLNYPGDLDLFVTRGRAALRVLDDHLTDRAIAGKLWVSSDRPSIADVALFSYVALSHDCGIGHEDYPAIALWQRQFRMLESFISMPGVPDYF